MARHFVAIDLLKKLVLALEDGITIDEADPNLNTDLHYILQILLMVKPWRLPFIHHI